METLYDQARTLGERVAAADLPIEAVRQQSKALCRAQGWGAGDPRWYEMARVAYQAYIAAKQLRPPLVKGSGEDA